MRERSAIVLILGMVLLVGFGLRVHHLLHVSPIADEYITMLATEATLEWGYPKLPSGLYYEHGLLFTYVGALLAGVFGFDQVVTRVPSLVFGLLVIATVYKAGRDWFSPRAGLMAATCMALFPEAITWSARARMYSLWMWLFFLGTYWLASGLLLDNSKRLRCLGIAALIGSGFSQILTLGYATPLAAGLALGWIMVQWHAARSVRLRDVIWPESGLLAFGVLSLLLYRRLGDCPDLAERATVSHWWFADPIALPARAAIYIRPFFRPPLFIVGLFAITGMLFLLFRLIRHPEPPDALLVCLFVLFGGSVIGLGTVSRYHAYRYISAMIPVFALLVGRELAFMGDLLARRSNWLVGLAAPLILVVGSLAPAAWTAATHDSINIDRAYAFVHQNRYHGDIITTTSPAAATLCLGRSDVYISANSHGPCTTGTDRWIGIPHYTCPEDFAALLAAEPRVWFIVDDWFWEHSLSAEFRDLIENEMTLVFHPVGARVYLHDE